MTIGNLISECIFEFQEDLKPEFLGRYHRTYKENNEMYYTDELIDDSGIYDNL